MRKVSSLAVNASLTTVPSCYIACHVMYKSCVCSYSRNENKCKKNPKDKKTDGNITSLGCQVMFSATII